MKDNELKMGVDSEDVSVIENRISLTRSKDLNWGPVRLTLNTDKLMSNYKIDPYVAYPDNAPPHEDRELSEEKLTKPIKNFNRYLESISLVKEDINWKIGILSDRYKRFVRVDTKISNNFWNLQGMKFISLPFYDTGKDVPIIVNNDIFVMKFLIKHPKLDSKSKLIAKNAIRRYKNILKNIEKIIQ